MPRKGDNIYKRKDGRWEGRYVKGRKNGRTIFGSVFGKTYQETRMKQAKARCAWDEGLLITKKGRTKLKAVSECWLRESEAFLKESTIAIYRNYLHKHIYPAFANTDLADISNEALSDFCVSLLENGNTDGHGLSPKTAAEVFRVMKQIRKFAMLRGIVVGYSADCVDIKQKAKPLRVFSQTEREMLFSLLSMDIIQTQRQEPVCLILIESMDHKYSEEAVQLLSRANPNLRILFITRDFFGGHEKSWTEKMKTHFDSFVYSAHTDMNACERISESFGELSVVRTTRSVDYDLRFRNRTLIDTIFDTNKTERYAENAPVYEPLYRKEEIHRLAQGICLIQTPAYSGLLDLR